MFFYYLFSIASNNDFYYFYFFKIFNLFEREREHEQVKESLSFSLPDSATPAVAPQGSLGVVTAVPPLSCYYDPVAERPGTSRTAPFPAPDDSSQQPQCHTLRESTGMKQRPHPTKPCSHSQQGDLGRTCPSTPQIALVITPKLPKKQSLHVESSCVGLPLEEWEGELFCLIHKSKKVIKTERNVFQTKE